MNNSTPFDVAVIGGGINGCGIARDAASRGLSVVLFEKGDLANGTSSASTKLIHGGLRYLEHYDFGLVRSALREREQILTMAPHIVWPLRFVLPHHGSLRPAWMIRLGLFLYDHIGGRKRLPASRNVSLPNDVAGHGLKPQFEKAFEYSDCWVDDARLVVLNAVDAAALGADIRVRSTVTSIESNTGQWIIQSTDANGDNAVTRARAVVNAAGPWVTDVIERQPSGSIDGTKIRLVKGSHIVVPRLFAHDRAYMFQNVDKRIVFAIPYEDDYTLIGTTDVDTVDTPDDVAPSWDEIDYLCAAVNTYVKQPISPTDVVHSFAGVRPLIDDGASSAQEATRDYSLNRLDSNGATIVNVFGGKITTYRRLAENCINLLSSQFATLGQSQSHLPLPGGDFDPDDLQQARETFKRRFGFLNTAHASRMFRCYGTQAYDLLGDARSLADLGRCFGADLYEREIRYLLRHEWAHGAEDILWRRTKLGLRLTNSEVDSLSDWIEGNR